MAAAWNMAWAFATGVLNLSSLVEAANHPPCPHGVFGTRRCALQKASSVPSNGLTGIGREHKWPEMMVTALWQRSILPSWAWISDMATITEKDMAPMVPALG